MKEQLVAKLIKENFENENENRFFSEKLSWRGQRENRKQIVLVRYKLRSVPSCILFVSQHGKVLKIFSCYVLARLM